MSPLEPAILTIFGISGDLSRRKLLPALYHLAEDGLLPPAFKIVGVSRHAITVDEVLQNIQSAVEADGSSCQKTTLHRLKDSISIVSIDITIQSEYSRLKAELDKLEDGLGVCLNRLFYLAIPSTVFGPVVARLGKADLNTGCQHGKAQSRLLIEKPFGYDLNSAKNLIAELETTYTEDQLYRIDHYLAKETVQNILTFRFKNPLFKLSWDKNHISHIMITAAESIGIEGRAVFYEQMGALRDIIQSHLLQLLALVTMEEPVSMSAADIHKSKTELLLQMKAPAPDAMQDKTVRGQYSSYKDEVGNAESNVETYTAIELGIENDRWAGVPMFIRTGKALKEKVTELTIVFYDKSDPACKNYLILRLQPNEGIVLNLRIKKPGFEKEVTDVSMDFSYRGAIDAAHPDAYERVLVDSMRGDQSLFATSEEVLANWRVTEPILDAWQADRVPLQPYPSGSWGPALADELLKNVDGAW